MRISTFVLLTSLLLFSACSENDTSATDQQDMIGATLNSAALSSSEGAALAKRKCASCHYLDRNIRKVGPSLKGIVGRAPSISGIPFDKWTEENLDRWIENPRAIKKKTRMALPGISDPAQRKAIIAYLKQI